MVEPTEPAPRRWWRAIDPVSVVVLLVAWVVLMSSIRGMLPYLNSDQLFLPSLVRDLFDGIPLDGWRMQPAPSFFPDLALYLPAALLTSDLGHTFALYSTFYLAALTGAAVLLARVAGVAPRRACVAVAAYVLMLRAYPAQFNFLTPAHHGGNLITALLLLAVAHGRATPRRLAGLIGLAALAAASDLLITVQVIAPLAAAQALAPPPRRDPLTRAAALVAGAALGYAVLVLAFQRTGMVPANAVARPLLDDGEVSRFLGDLGSQLRESPLLAVLVVATTAAFARRSDARAGLVRHFWPLSLAATLVLPVAAFRWDAGLLRYLQPLYALPVFLLVAVARLRRPAAAVALAAALGAWIYQGGLASVARVEVPTPSGLALPHLDWIDCLDELAAKRGLRIGLAAYWESKPVAHYSRAGLRALAVDAGVRPFVWIANTAWYGELADAPDDIFVVGDHINAGALADALGQPLETVACPEHPVRRYKLLDPKIRARLSLGRQPR